MNLYTDPKPSHWVVNMRSWAYQYPLNDLKRLRVTHSLLERKKRRKLLIHLTSAEPQHTQTCCTPKWRTAKRIGIPPSSTILLMFSSINARLPTMPIAYKHDIEVISQDLVWECIIRIYSDCITGWSSWIRTWRKALDWALFFLLHVEAASYKTRKEEHV